MARDRLAALRAQQQAQRQAQQQAEQQTAYNYRSSYPSPGIRRDNRYQPRHAQQQAEQQVQQQAAYEYRSSYPSLDDWGREYQPHRTQQWAQQQAQQHVAYDRYPSLGVGRVDMYRPPPIEYDSLRETQEVRDSPVSYDRTYEMSAFYAEISLIQDNLRTFNDNVSRISDLHSRSLHYMDDAGARRNAAQIDGLAKETSLLSNQLKTQIKNLHKQRGSGRDGQIRQQQTGLVRHKFVEAIRNYQQVEQQYRTKYKHRVERQFKTVKPDATPEEVKAVVNDEQGAEIFAQAVRQSNRYGESRMAFREVQGRHEDIKKIERTLSELAQLFNDMSVLIAQQDRNFDEIQVMATNVEKNAEVGLQYTDNAIASVRARRRRKWICIWIAVAIVFIVIGSTVAIVVTVMANNNNY